MKKTSLPELRQEYQRLKKELAALGYISQGSVLDRSKLKGARTGFQWTRKVANKTITVSLSRDQYQALKQAVVNERRLWRTVKRMEQISRQILFQTLPDTTRRKVLSKKVLGIN